MFHLIQLLFPIGILHNLLNGNKRKFHLIQLVHFSLTSYLTSLFVQLIFPKQKEKRCNSLSYIFPSGQNLTVRQGEAFSLLWSSSVCHVAAFWFIFFCILLSARLTKKKTLSPNPAWTLKIVGARVLSFQKAKVRPSVKRAAEGQHNTVRIGGRVRGMEVVRLTYCPEVKSTAKGLIHLHSCNEAILTFKESVATKHSGKFEACFFKFWAYCSGWCNW